MKKDLIIDNIIKLLLPLIFIFGIYLQLNGESQSGGGFQAGMIFATGLILYGLTDSARLKFLISHKIVEILMTLGVILYFTVGFICMIKGGEFLDYYFLLDPKKKLVQSQQLAINIVELGVAITVCFVTVKIFYLFSEANKNDND